VIRSLRNPLVRRNSILLALAFAVQIPAYFVAVFSVLKASQVDFLDYGLVPVFAIIVSYAAERTVFVSSVPDGFGKALCIGGVVMLIASQPLVDSSGGWPNRWEVDHSKWLGLSCLLISSFCGAGSLQFARNLVHEVDRSYILTVKLVPIGVAFPLAVLMIDRTALVFDRMHSFYGSLMGLLVMMPLFLLYGILKVNTVARFAPYLFLIPVMTLVLSFVLRIRQSSDVPALEWSGMVVIFLGLLLSENAPRVVRALGRFRAHAGEAPPLDSPRC
jgi:hypothetical protein